jgi:hypothetical protein
MTAKIPVGDDEVDLREDRRFCPFGTTHAKVRFLLSFGRLRLQSLKRWTAKFSGPWRRKYAGNLQRFAAPIASFDASRTRQPRWRILGFPRGNGPRP